MVKKAIIDKYRPSFLSGFDTEGFTVHYDDKTLFFKVVNLAGRIHVWEEGSNKNSFSFDYREITEAVFERDSW